MYKTLSAAVRPLPCDEAFAVRTVDGLGRIGLDIDGYTDYVCKLGKHINPANVDAKVLDGMLSVAVAAGDLLDLYKKLIVYGQTGLTERLLKANTALRAANIAVDDAIVQQHIFHPEPLQHEINLELLHGAIGMFGESAEILRAIQEQAQTGVLDEVNVVEELGDTIYYVAYSHAAIGATMYQSTGRNKAKLDVRFGPKNEWSQDAVINRNLDAERVALGGTAA